jgi:hypothetical protein
MQPFPAPTWRNLFKDLLSLNMQIYVPELAIEEFDEDFRSGLIHGLFIKRDQRLVGEIFDEISCRLANSDFRDHIVALFRKNLIEQARETGSEVIQNQYLDLVKFAIVIDLKGKIEGLSWEKYVIYCSNLYAASALSQRPATAAVREFLRDKHLIYKIAELLFQHLSRYDGSRFITPKDSLLVNEYADHDINLFYCDAQFNAYGLLTVVEELEFSDLKPLEPLDRRVEKHLSLDVDEQIVRELIALKKDGYIGTLSFRPRLNLGLRSRTSVNIALESIERGNIFELSKLNKPDHIKLYSANYDTLWVNVENGEITFEEILSDIVIEGDYLVTQVIHLQHSIKHGVAIINHIDHEFIYYTLDEYESRQSNPNQKGAARPRIKTFKVDDACIPFTLPDGRWFLYLVLEAHFTRIDLVTEYFEKVL